MQDTGEISSAMVPGTSKAALVGCKLALSGTLRVKSLVAVTISVLQLVKKVVIVYQIHFTCPGDLE